MAAGKLKFAPNIYERNEIYSLSWREKCRLSAVAYLKNKWEEKVESTTDGIFILSDRLTAAFPQYTHCLLISHVGWQRPDRIVNHIKLWSSMVKDNIVIPDGVCSNEVLIKGNNGIKYAGYIKGVLPTHPDVVSIIRPERPSRWNSYLVFIDNAASSTLDQFLAEGWESMWPDIPMRIVDLVCEANAVVYLPLGWFDDRESGCVVIGQPDLLAKSFPEFLSSG